MLASAINGDAVVHAGGGLARDRGNRTRAPPMPYFQRQPIEGLVDAVLSNVPTPGLPSRGPALPAAVVAGTRPVSPAAAITGIVDQAAAVLASERPSVSREPSARSDAGSVASTQSTRISQLQEQVNALIEQLVALAGRPPGSATSQRRRSTILAGREPPFDAAQLIVEPAPVLSPPGPVAPGGTAQISISLVNEDEQPAQIVVLQHRPDRRGWGADLRPSASRSSHGN